MKYIIYILSAIMLPAIAIPVCAQSDSFAVFFAQNKCQPDVRQKAELDSFLETGRLQKAPSVVIIGYGDKIGGDPANMKISQLRANGILEYLATKGIPKEKILSCRGFGIRNPNAGKDTSATDRRVNILIMKQPLDNDIARVLPQLQEGQTYVLKNINFLMAKHHLDTSSYGDLEQLYLTLLQHPQLKIKIEGHICCGQGDSGDAYDLDNEEGYYSGYNLSVHRAKFITSYLISKGIDTGRLSYTGYGNSKPLVTPEKSMEDQKKNRRVEIRIIAK